MVVPARKHMKLLLNLGRELRRQKPSTEQSLEGPPSKLSPPLVEIELFIGGLQNCL